MCAIITGMYSAAARVLGARTPRKDRTIHTFLHRSLVVGSMMLALAACGSSNAAPATTTPSDPEIVALVADPVAWWQQREDAITDAVCRSDRQALLNVVSASSRSLSNYTDAFGKCLHVTINKIRVGPSGADCQAVQRCTAADYKLGDNMIHFYVTDSGWSGPNHEWSATFVHEDGHWKLQNG